MNVLNNDPKSCALYSDDMRKCKDCKPQSDQPKCYRPMKVQ